MTSTNSRETALFSLFVFILCSPFIFSLFRISSFVAVEKFPLVLHSYVRLTYIIAYFLEKNNQKDETKYNLKKLRPSVCNNFLFCMKIQNIICAIRTESFFIFRVPRGRTYAASDENFSCRKIAVVFRITVKSIWQN